MDTQTLHILIGCNPTPTRCTGVLSSTATGTLQGPTVEYYAATNTSVCTRTPGIHTSSIHIPDIHIPDVCMASPILAPIPDPIIMVPGIFALCVHGWSDHIHLRISLSSMYQYRYTYTTHSRYIPT